MTAGAQTTRRWRNGTWIVFALILVFSGLLDMAEVLTWPNLRQPLSPPNPDSWLRLAMVKQWLTTNGFFNHLVANTNAPLGGISIHWTRPLDFVLSFLVKLMPASALNMKLLLAACWYPVLLALITAAVMTRGAEKIFRHNHVLACTLLLMIASPYMPDYFKPGDADHHGMMSLLWCGAVVLLLDKNIARCGSFAAGLLLGLIIWMSPEGLLLLAVCLGLTGFAALKNNSRIEDVLFLTLGAAVMTTIGLFFEVPVAEIFSHQTYDSLSIVHSAFLWLASGGAAFLCLLWPFSRNIGGRIYLTAAAGASVALLMYAFYPRFFLGPFADADPFVFTGFLPMVQEAHSLFHNIQIGILRYLMEPVMAGLLLGVAFRMKYLRPERRIKLLKLSGLFAFTFALTLYQQRFLYYVEPVVIIICAGLLPVVAIGWQKFGFAPRRWQPYLWLVSAFVVTTALALSPLLLPSPATSKGIDGSCLQEMRQVVQTEQLQKLLGDKNLVLYTFEDVGAEVLFFTPYRIIASNYHREAAGLKDMKAIREAVKPEELHTLLKKRQVDAMLFCPAYHLPEEILHYIADDKTRPKWLVPVTGMHFMKPEGFKPVLLRVKK